MFPHALQFLTQFEDAGVSEQRSDEVNGQAVMAETRSTQIQQEHLLLHRQLDQGDALCAHCTESGSPLHVHAHHTPRLHRTTREGGKKMSMQLNLEPVLRSAFLSY